MPCSRSALEEKSGFYKQRLNKIISSADLLETDLQKLRWVIILTYLHLQLSPFFHRLNSGVSSSTKYLKSSGETK
jgi:hypothetical protein